MNYDAMEGRLNYVIVPTQVGGKILAAIAMLLEFVVLKETVCSAFILSIQIPNTNSKVFQAVKLIKH